MKQEGYYCYIEDCIVYASDHPEDREHPLGKAIVQSEYDNWGYFYIEGDTIYVMRKMDTLESWNLEVDWFHQIRASKVLAKEDNYLTLGNKKW